LSATLTAIDQSGESETLSAPRLTLINNLPATIQDGTIQYYYEEYQVKQEQTQYASASTVLPQGKPTSLVSGVMLNVLASIGNDGKSVMLALKPEVTEDVQMVTFATISDHDAAGNVTSTFDIKLPQVRKQSLSTRLTIKSGQTIALGGVLSRKQTTFVEAVPVLGKLPLIGAAFRRRIEQDSPRYLLIFVTATILSESGEFVVSPEEK
jgi:type II secretory pathway component GspD/PulD (secretin)